MSSQVLTRKQNIAITVCVSLVSGLFLAWLLMQAAELEESTSRGVPLLKDPGLFAAMFLSGTTIGIGMFYERYFLPWIMRTVHFVWWPSNRLWVFHEAHARRAWGIYWGARLRCLYAVVDGGVYAIPVLQPFGQVEIEYFSLRLRRPVKNAKDAGRFCLLCDQLDQNSTEYVTRKQVTSLLNATRRDFSLPFVVNYPTDRYGYLIRAPTKQQPLRATAQHLQVVK